MLEEKLLLNFLLTHNSHVYSGQSRVMKWAYLVWFNKEWQEILQNFNSGTNKSIKLKAKSKKFHGSVSLLLCLHSHIYYWFLSYKWERRERAALGSILKERREKRESGGSGVILVGGVILKIWNNLESNSDIMKIWRKIWEYERFGEYIWERPTNLVSWVNTKVSFGPKSNV